MNERKANFERKSKETEIKTVLNIDGKGATKIKTPIGLLDHMLELFAFHGFFDLELEVKGDTHIDIHHTNEDIGIVLGKAFKKALGEKEGIKRFGSAFAPMEATLGHSVVDISGRGYLKIDYSGGDLVAQEELTTEMLKVLSPGDTSKEPTKNQEYTFKHIKHFLESFAHQLGANIVITIKHTESADLHTIMETIFKSLGLALDQATQIDPRRGGSVPSTKGIID